MEGQPPNQGQGRVLMIVRTTSPRGSPRETMHMNAGGVRRVTSLNIMASPHEGGNNDGQRGFHGAPSFAAMEADFRQQQFQRQRMQLLSMAIFLCFMVLFFDNRAESRHRQHHLHTNGGMMRNQPQGGAYGNGNVSTMTERLNQFKHVLQHEHGYDARAPVLNISGIYSGAWESMRKADFDTKEDNSSQIVPFLRIVRDDEMPQYDPSVERGHSWLFIKMKPPATEELKDDVAYLSGQLVIYDQEASLAATIMPIQGVYLRKLRKVTLFGNAPDSNVLLLYNKTNSSNPMIPTTTSDAVASGVVALNRNGENIVDGIPFAYDRNKYGAFDVSPPRYTYITRFRSSDSFSDQCISVIQMQLMDEKDVPAENDLLDPISKDEQALEDKTKDPYGLRRKRLVGTLGSRNCGLYMRIEARFREENLDLFFSKASHYAILMTFVAMGEIYFLLRQLQVSNTQATAAKISLLCIGQQAVLDSYLCLGHLTVGIVSKNVFTAFASVAFVKLVIFSVFEMRYLLIIWKARRPQGFAEGWITVRRELTTLYSRFYLSLLLGLVLLYNLWAHLPWLVFVAYSFWLPQIIHNVHREVRSPFDPAYLYGMSALRMLLPLYFYGCPSNFLTAFPMYESKVNQSFCLLLTSWMALQIAVLSLQHKYGPRFFVPARFLPVKYNYERRITAQELSLVRTSANDDDTIDCVICMVEMDISARDYMIAPCDHIFHRECLQGWMQVKMECPTCRCVLPEP